MSKPAIKRVNPLAAMRDGEEVVCEINRHPAGLFAMFGAGTGLLLVIALLSIFLLPSFSLSLTVFLLAAVLVVGFLFLAQKIYWGNYWVVTSDSITQMTRNSLFDKQVVQLSFANLEDVATEQKGVWAHLFHYGTISAETAGATDKFTMTFCPNPTVYAQKILVAREAFEHGDSKSRSKSDDSTAQATKNDDSNIDSYDVPMGD